MASHAEELNVVWGTGPLGLSVMEELRARGQRVRMVNRSGKAEVPDGVEVVRGDATHPESARAASQGATTLYNCTNAPYTEWPEKFPAIWAGITDAAASVGAKLVAGDNLYMYGPVSSPIREALPYAATDRKGRTRAAMATALLEAHRSGKVRATIGRASNFYGPRVRDSSIGERVFDTALKGGTVDLIGNPDLPHTATFIRDFARGLVTLGEHDEALGRAWHVPSAPTLTTRQFVEMVFRQAGTSPKIRVAPKPLLTVMAWVNPMMREVKEMLYEFEESYIVDHSQFERAFGSHTTPHEEAIRETLEWYRAQQ